MPQATLNAKPIVLKFGGTSLANASQYRKAQAIVESDAARRYVVVSAPGKRHQDDIKITDLLYQCYQHAGKNEPFDEPLTQIQERFEAILSELNVALDLGPALAEIRSALQAQGNAQGAEQFAASRGEYLSAQVMAALLGVPFVDSVDVIAFTDDGKLDADTTQQKLSAALAQHERAVLPGFYGSDPLGAIRTFSRGGSDVTGSLVARAVNAAAYENWTDVSGLLMADPRIVDGPCTMELLTYRELRELSYSGASVLHEEAIFPVRQAGIPVHIRNTNDPQAPGSQIVAEVPASEAQNPQGGITGIAGRTGFTVFAIEQAMMNSTVGFGRKVLQVFEAHGVSFEHMPSGIDTLSVVVDDKQIAGKLTHVVDAIKAEVQPDNIEVYPGMALIAVVGRRMAMIPGMAARVFAALAQADINIRMIDQGSSELNIIVGVEANDYPTAVRAIYAAFDPEK